MSQKILDGSLGDADIDTIMDSIIAQNPQLNAQIESVRNESNVFLCEVLRVYQYEDKALVRILNNNKRVFCRLSHEILSNGMCIDYLPNGIEKTDNNYLIGKKYIQPFDEHYAIMIKVRWLNLKDENILLGYVNIYDRGELKTSNDKGELSLKSGSSMISVNNERVNIITPHLFINGLPYNEPELKNYFDKDETNVILNSLDDKYALKDEIPSIVSGDYVEKTDLVNKNKYDIDLNLNFGLSGIDDSISIDMDIVNYIVDKTININGD